MTVSPDGTFLTWAAGHHVTHLITTARDGSICGLITCQACHRSWLYTELRDIDREYAARYVQTLTGWAALAHAKTCTGAAD